ncbi:MAG: carboxypeptidase regulatory-like domain-containing protein [Janthinobacterium lividum]
MNYFASLLLSFGLLASFLPTWAQPTGSIQGCITTTDGDPAEAVSVGLPGLALGSLTNSAGHYTIGAVPAGTYTIRVS